MNICAVFTCNKNFFGKFVETCSELYTKGKYKGDVCLVIGDDLKYDSVLNHDFIIKNNIVVKHFPNIQFPNEFLEMNNKISGNDGRHITKKFQWHKLHLFNVFFKQWQYVFYLDCGATIFSDVSPILNEAKKITLLAHSDAYPAYNITLDNQFDRDLPPFKKLNETYNLGKDYFQTTIMLYDTKIIEEDTFSNLRKLMLEYPICKTNEQGIIALYFTIIKPVWEQLRLRNEETNFYDYGNRNQQAKYIILKYASLMLT